MAERKYALYDFTISLCSQCLKRVYAKIVFEEGCVYMLKTCSEHGFEKVQIATDIEYYKRCRNYIKPGEMSLTHQTEMLHGCPYDCGLCPDHEQHSCLSLIEITDRCNLACPTCYASSAPMHGNHRTLEEIEKMLDVVIASEGRADIVQISGGEPTIHPQFFEVLDLAKTKPIRHLMLNTNGVRIAKDEDFVKQLSGYMPGFEVYLQFDSFESEVLQHIRGEDLREVRRKAIEHLNKYNIPTTLVVVIQRDQNVHEIGKIIEYALQQPCIRGVTFQPVQIAGRIEGFNPEKDKVTMTEIRQEILKQSPIFQDKDLIPVPCNSDALVMGYALKIENEVYPLTRYIDPTEILEHSKNTIIYEQDERLKNHFLKVFSTGNSVDDVKTDLQELMCCLPMIDAPDLKYHNLFRIIIMNFIDAYNFDVRIAKKSCVHIVSKDYRLIPFETMNILYRDRDLSTIDKSI